MESFRTWRDATGDDWCMVQISSENEGYGEVVPRMTNSVGFCAMDSTPCLNMFEHVWTIANPGLPRHSNELYDLQLWKRIVCIWLQMIGSQTWMVGHIWALQSAKCAGPLPCSSHTTRCQVAYMTTTAWMNPPWKDTGECRSVFKSLWHKHMDISWIFHMDIWYFMNCHDTVDVYCFTHLYIGGFGDCSDQPSEGTRMRRAMAACRPMRSWVFWGICALAS